MPRGAASGVSPGQPIDLTGVDDASGSLAAVSKKLGGDGNAKPPASRKRKVAPATDDGPVEDLSSPKKKKGKKNEEPPAEKRLRKFRQHQPVSLSDVLERATTQRFFVLKREQCGTEDCPEEKVQLTGLTGNIYEVHIARQPTCSCPQGLDGKQCKHILFVLHRVLRARFELVYQLALLSSELREIFGSSQEREQAAQQEAAEKEKLQAEAAEKTKALEDKMRKPIEGECPICYSGLDADSHESIVWCQAACGQNFHRQCVSMWVKTMGAGTCPLCRSAWKGEEVSTQAPNNRGGFETAEVVKSRGTQSEAYINVADQLGISQERDLYQYSRWWRGHPIAYKRRPRPPRDE